MDNLTENGKEHCMQLIVSYLQNFHHACSCSSLQNVHYACSSSGMADELQEVLARFLARIMMDHLLNWRAFTDIPGLPQKLPRNVPALPQRGEKVRKFTFQHRRRVQPPSTDENCKVESTATTCLNPELTTTTATWNFVCCTQHYPVTNTGKISYVGSIN